MKFGVLCLMGLPASTFTAYATPVPKPECVIVVNKFDNTLKFLKPGAPPRVYKVATGKYRCTPEGSFRVIQRTFVSKEGRGQFGTRWLGLNTLGRRGWYRIGIHGTNEPASIGKYASKACVRMRNQEINELFDQVPMGTKVLIINRDLPEPTRTTSAYVTKPLGSAFFFPRVRQPIFSTSLTPWEGLSQSVNNVLQNTGQSGSQTGISLGFSLLDPLRGRHPSLAYLTAKPSQAPVFHLPVSSELLGANLLQSKPNFAVPGSPL